MSDTFWVIMSVLAIVSGIGAVVGVIVAVRGIVIFERKPRWDVSEGHVDLVDRGARIFAWSMALLLVLMIVAALAAPYTYN